MIEVMRGLGHAVAGMHALEDFDRVPVLVHARTLAAAH